jgi:hypothetical protein
MIPTAHKVLSMSPSVTSAITKVSLDAPINVMTIATKRGYNSQLGTYPATNLLSPDARDAKQEPRPYRSIISARNISLQVPQQKQETPVV